MKIFNYELEILGVHLDVFGHVNNAVYFQLYEMARWDFIEKNGYGLKKIIDLKKGPVILDMAVTFRSELRNRDFIKIESWPCGMKNKFVMKLSQKMIKKDGTEASTLDLSIGLFDLDKRKLIIPTKEWLRAIGEIEG
jgi:acyl-CoA thioester hydrolase